MRKNLVQRAFLLFRFPLSFPRVSRRSNEWWRWYDKDELNHVCLPTVKYDRDVNFGCFLIQTALLLKSVISYRHAYILVIVVWIYALSLSLPPFFNWGKYGLETNNISCSVSWEHHDPETNNDTYIGFLFSFGFATPVVIIIASYCGIICTLRKIRRRVRKFSLLLNNK